MVFFPRLRFLGHRRLGDGNVLDLSLVDGPRTSRRFLLWAVAVLVLIVDPVCGGPRYSSRIVEIQTGAIRGVILELNSRHLEPVEAFRGVPYAAPPVGPLRFRRPQPPLPWPGTRLADAFGPVCPQNPPDIQNRTAALLTMPKGRYAYLKKLVPHLANQSEDCLFLNIYVPGSVLELLAERTPNLKEIELFLLTEVKFPSLINFQFLEVLHISSSHGNRHYSDLYKFLIKFPALKNIFIGYCDENVNSPETITGKLRIALEPHGITVRARKHLESLHYRTDSNFWKVSKTQRLYDFLCLPTYY